MDPLVFVVSPALASGSYFETASPVSVERVDFDASKLLKRHSIDIVMGMSIDHPT